MKKWRKVSISVQQRWGKCSLVHQQEWGNGYLVIFNGKRGNGSMVKIYQEWGNGFVLPVSWKKEKIYSLLPYLKINKIRRWFPGSRWTGNEEMISSFFWAENEETIWWLLLSRKLGDGTLVPVRPEMKENSPVHGTWKGETVPLYPANRTWGNAHEFLWRKWGDICYPVKQWKWGNGSLVSDDRFWGEESLVSVEPKMRRRFAGSCEAGN